MNLLNFVTLKELYNPGHNILALFTNLAYV